MGAKGDNIVDSSKVLPIRLVNRSLEVLKTAPESHFALTICKALEQFPIRPSLQMPFDDWRNPIAKQCSDELYQCGELIEGCRNVVRERKVLKVLENFREMIQESLKVLRIHEEQEKEAEEKKRQAEENRKKADGKKRSAPPSSQSDKSESENAPSSQEDI